MKKYAVITGDIIDFTSVGNKRREELIGDTDDNIKRWVKQPEDAAIFRGDSFQLIFEDPDLAVIRSIQLICWFKKQAEPKFPHLSTRISLGIGGLAFKGKTVLDSDGEAFHLSGRNFDLLETDELLRISTGKAEQDELLAVLLTFMNLIMNGWSSQQAEVVYWVLEDQNATQEKIGKRLNMYQSNIAKRLKAAHWKEMEKGIRFISAQLQKA